MTEFIQDGQCVRSGATNWDAHTYRCNQFSLLQRELDRNSFEIKHLGEIYEFKAGHRPLLPQNRPPS